MELLKEIESDPFSPLKNEILKLKEMLLCQLESITKQAEVVTPSDACQDEQIRESLNAKIRDLENHVKVKEWLLETRDAQLRKVKSDLQEKELRLAAKEREECGSNGRRKLWKQAFGG